MNPVQTSPQDIKPPLKRFCGSGLYETEAPHLQSRVSKILAGTQAPTNEEWDEVLKVEARQILQDYGQGDAEGLILSGRVVVTEVQSLPEPPAGDPRPLLPWKISAVISCEELRSDFPVSLILEWQEKPEGEVLKRILEVMTEDALALKGHHQSYAEVSEVLNLQIEPAT